MNIKLTYIYISLFIILALILLPVMNSDYLFTIQELGVFTKGRTFMLETINQNGGVIAWFSTYLTQFFFHPWFGSSIIIAIWTAIYFMAVRTFRIVNSKWSAIALIPVLFLLFNILDYGYWIYYTKTTGFVFTNTLSFFIITLIVFIIFEIIYKVKTLKAQWITIAFPSLTYIIVAVAFQCFTSSIKLFDHKSEIATTLTDKNFRHELSMYIALDEGDYEKVIDEAKGIDQPPTNLMVLFKNIALMHTDRLTEMFLVDNCGTTPAHTDSLYSSTAIPLGRDRGNLNIRTIVLAGPQVYYQFGQINFAYRWAVENNVKHGVSFRNLKFLTKCAIINQEYEVATKYINILKASIFYRDWAYQHETWIYNSTTFLQSREIQLIAPLMQDEPNFLDGDNGLCEKWLLDHFSDIVRPANPKLENVIMTLALWTKDDYSFMFHFVDYARQHQGQPIPQLYQEAAIMISSLPGSQNSVESFPFDTSVSTRYNNFAREFNDLVEKQLAVEDIANRLKPLYGDTYWWYYYFYTDFNIY